MGAKLWNGLIRSDIAWYCMKCSLDVYIQGDPIYNLRQNALIKYVFLVIEYGMIPYDWCYICHTIWYAMAQCICTCIHMILVGLAWYVTMCDLFWYDVEPLHYNFWQRTCQLSCNILWKDGVWHYSIMENDIMYCDKS